MSDGGFDPSGGFGVYTGKGVRTKRGIIALTVFCFVIAVVSFFLPGGVWLGLLFLGISALGVVSYFIQKSRGTLKG